VVVSGAVETVFGVLLVEVDEEEVELDVDGDELVVEEVDVVDGAGDKLLTLLEGTVLIACTGAGCLADGEVVVFGLGDVDVCVLG